MAGATRQDYIWMASGAAVLLAVFLAIMHFYPDPVVQAARKAARIDLVEGMRSALNTASDAERSAIHTGNDDEARRFADQAREATAMIDRKRLELAEHLGDDATEAEGETLARFAEAFVEFRRIELDLLDLAAMNTNVKAYAEAYGPAAGTLAGMDAALARLVDSTTGARESAMITRLAFSARLAALRIQAMLPRHIAEADDREMDAMEATMSADGREVRRSLEALAALDDLRLHPDLEAARERNAHYAGIVARILVLSRQNTNVRSLSVSLNEKRKATLLCRAALDALLQAVLDEPPLPGRTTNGRFR